MSVLVNDSRSQLEDLYAQMRPRNLYPLWEVLASLVTPVPQGKTESTKWSFGEVRNYLMRAGDLISAQDAERRVLILENAGLPGASSATSSLYAGLQLILPGEIAPCHRHTQCALRFIMEGSGAFTAVDGEKAVMEKYDLILTPNWQWHDHGNTTNKPMIWLDGLDVPMVSHFDVSFSEKLGADAQIETVAPDDSISRYGRNMRPIRGSSADRRPANLPLFHYRYTEWRASLAALAAAEAPDPYLGHALEFLNPADGGPIMPTISAHVRHIPAGFTTLPRRSTDATIFVVVEGDGQATVGKTEHRLSEGDIFVLPSWDAFAVEASSDMVLFGYSDRAAQEKLGLYREARE